MREQWQGQSLFVPRRLDIAFAYLKHIDSTFPFRKVATYESLGNRVPVLILAITGKGNRQTLTGIEFAYADFESIGAVYALAYVYKASGEGRVRRFHKDSPWILVSADIPEKAKEYLAYLQGE